MFASKPFKEKEIDFNYYQKKIESGEWRGKVVFGISDRTGDFRYVDPVKQPGAAYVGGMGSGKSEAMKFTITTAMATDGDRSIFIFVDPMKGMGDYVAFFDQDNVVKCLSSVQKFTTVIDQLWSEYNARNNEFMRVGANNIYSYEEIKKNPKSPHYDPNFTNLARIYVFAEEFHGITTSKELDFFNKVDTENTTAWMFAKLMKVARSHGIYFFIATQRATADDIPSTLKTGINVWNVFKVNNPSDASAANLPHAADIMGGYNGRCAVEGGFLQFPYLPNESIAKILKKYKKKYNAVTIGAPLEIYKKAMEAEGASGLVWIKPFSWLIANASSIDRGAFIERYFSIFGISLQKQEKSSLVADYIATKGTKKYGVVIHKPSRRDYGSDNDESKDPQLLMKAVEILNLDGIISVSFSDRDPLSSLKGKVDYYSVDKGELERSAKVLDERAKLGQDFDILFSQLVLSKIGEAKQDGDKSVDDDGDNLSSFFSKFS